MSWTKLYAPSQTTLRQLFNRQLLSNYVLFLIGKIAPNSVMNHEIIMWTLQSSMKWLVCKNAAQLSVYTYCTKLVRQSTSKDMVNALGMTRKCSEFICEYIYLLVQNLDVTGILFKRIYSAYCSWKRYIQHNMAKKNWPIRHSKNTYVT